MPAAPAPIGRAKRVTDPLHDRVKARLRGDDGDHQYRPPAGRYPSSSGSGSGSEHGAGDLSGFVRGFFDLSDDEGSEADAACDDGDERGDGEDVGLSDCEARQPLCAVPAASVIRDLVNPRAAATAEDRFRRDLVARASEAAEASAGLRENRPAFLRSVMASLRGMGYQAGICKSRRERGGGGGTLAAGSYEYIDVVTAGPSPAPGAAQQQQRYIVDLEFAGEFEIARPTAEYERAAAELPRVFVGRPEDLRRLLRVLAHAVRSSLRAREMHVPPWRKARYMQAKWLGPYRRTLNPVPSGSTPAPPSTVQSASPGRGGVKCRFVGFDTASPAVIFPPAPRTR